MYELMWRDGEIRINQAAAKSICFRERRAPRDDFFAASVIRVVADLVMWVGKDGKEL